MEVQLIQCTVKTNQDGNTGLMEVVLAGPSSIPVTEIPLLRRQHEDKDADGGAPCCIDNAKVVGDVTITDRKAHKDYLMRKYGAKLVEAEYPGSIPRNFPVTLDDCDIPKSNQILAPKEGTKDWFAVELKKLNVDFPDNASKKDLEALYEEMKPEAA